MARSVAASWALVLILFAVITGCAASDDAGDGDSASVRDEVHEQRITQALFLAAGILALIIVPQFIFTAPVRARLYTLSLPCVARG